MLGSFSHRGIGHRKKILKALRNWLQPLLMILAGFSTGGSSQSMRRDPRMGKTRCYWHEPKARFQALAGAPLGVEGDWEEASCNMAERTYVPRKLKEAIRPMGVQSRT